MKLFIWYQLGFVSVSNKQDKRIECFAICFANVFRIVSVNQFKYYLSQFLSLVEKWSNLIGWNIFHSPIWVRKTRKARVAVRRHRVIFTKMFHWSKHRMMSLCDPSFTRHHVYQFAKRKNILKVGQQQLKLTRKQTTFQEKFFRRFLRIMSVQGWLKKFAKHFKTHESSKNNLSTLNAENSIPPRMFFIQTVINSLPNARVQLGLGCRLSSIETASLMGNSNHF